MPRLVIDFSKTIIYHFVCKDATITNSYVGSTTNFTNRKRQHKHSCIKENNAHHNQKKYQMMRDNGGWDNWEMVPLEEFPCENNIQARIREQYWMNQLNPTMNTDRAYKTEEDQKKDDKKCEEDRKHRYNTDPEFKKYRRSQAKVNYHKNKESYAPISDEQKQKTYEINKERRLNMSMEQQIWANNYSKWYAWKKKPYESILFQSFIQKLLK